MSDADLEHKVQSYLQNHQVMTLATTGKEGVWAAAVFYVNDGFDLYFLSASHTQHSQNVRFDANVAATIQEDYRDWHDIKGIQLAGEVILLGEGDQERETAVVMYRQKYPFINEVDTQLQTALKKVNWYHLRPKQLYFIDNSKGLGHRDEVSMVH